MREMNERFDRRAKNSGATIDRFGLSHVNMMTGIVLASAALTCRSCPHADRCSRWPSASHADKDEWQKEIFRIDVINWAGCPRNRGNAPRDVAVKEL